MQKALILSFLAAFSFVQKAAAQDRFRFVKHVDAGGPKIQPGDYADAHLYVFYKEEYLQSTRTHGAVPGMPAPIYLPTAEQMAKQAPENGVSLGLLQMGVGDSISVFEVIDAKTPPLPDIFKTEKEVRIDIKVVSRKMAEQLQLEKAQREAEKGKLQLRVPEIKAEIEEIARKKREGLAIEGAKKLPSGLEILVKEAGIGEQVAKGQPIEANYFGVLTATGQMFDNSFDRGEPLPVTVGVGQVIPGWDEGLLQFKKGGKGWLIIPSGMAYGEAGAGGIIPAGADLIFYIEVNK